jgi:hypothetical protein
MLRPQIGLQLWKIWMLRWILIVLGKLLERTSTFLPKSLGYYELRSISYGLTKDAQNY